MEQIFFLADYITLNISSPNTKNLRDLHSEDSLNLFLKQVKKKHDSLTKKHRKHVPLVLKVSPDIQYDSLENFCKIAIDYEIDGIIATNTTIDKSVLNDKSIYIEGGISGKPLLNKSNNLIKAIKDQVGSKIKIIGTGGITTKESAIYKLECGADLIQMYTGLVYKGTNLIREITSNIK